jgi:hypothetical protein
MAGFRLTATKIERYRPAKSDEMLADGNGLAVRFRRRRAGDITRTWLYTYKTGNRSAYLTLGDYNIALDDFTIDLYHLPDESRLTLETARRIAAELQAWRQRGLDPKRHIQTTRDSADRLAEEKAQSAAALYASLQQESLTG